MKFKTKRSLLLVVMIFSMGMLMSFTAGKEKTKKPWNVPTEYKTKKNPYSGDKSLVKIGKNLYSKHCKSCHGNKGLGDGPKAKKMKAFLGVFNSKEFQAQTDGELFYKSIIGRDEMPNYEKKISDDEDQWAVIMYIRTLK